MAEIDVRGLLERLNEGDREAYDSLLPLIYEELRRSAHRLMSREREDHTLQTTALVNEAWLRLFDFRGARWEDRGHFLGVASKAMRHVLVDHARGRGRLKRGGQAPHVPLDELDRMVQGGASFFGCGDLDVLALNQALDTFEAKYPRQASVVELLFFAGISHPEAAEVLGLSLSTVNRDWGFARVWLLREMEQAVGSSRRDRNETKDREDQDEDPAR